MANGKSSDAHRAQFRSSAVRPSSVESLGRSDVDWPAVLPVGLDPAGD